MIKIQAQASKMTQEALEALLRTSGFVPEDKLGWSPMGAARPANDQLAECIQFAEALCTMLTVDFLPSQVDREKLLARRQQIMEQCKDTKQFAELARAKYTELCQVMENMPDSRLEHEFKLPFGRGRTLLGTDMLFLAYWNLVYHTGQINYIQTMLGDTDMH